ncbi:FISUMP domain-containing protein [Bacteroidota bacterium]
MKKNKPLHLVALSVLTIFILLLSGCKKDDDDLPNLNTGIIFDSRDNTFYATITIGWQEWMAENLNYKTDSGSWGNDNNGWIWYDDLGRLYSLETAKIACPEGWHLPSDQEWKDLEEFLGMNQNDVTKNSIDRPSGDVGLKLKSDEHMVGFDQGTNEVGFNALALGIAEPDGFINNPYTNASFWTSTQKDQTTYWYRGLDKDNNGIARQAIDVEYSLSVRCIKDE